jgi:ubiquinone/menaquinone biosynthesis C-methylase UbiE
VFPYAWLDSWAFRRPFEGRTARVYARHERPAFGDLDERLLVRLLPELSRARRFLDVGAGNHELAEGVARAHPGLSVIAVEPSASYTRRAHAGVVTLRGLAEALPLERGSIDVAVCLSSLRHVRDRRAALRELRRVVHPGGAVLIVELDPRADADRSARHRRALGSRLTRLTFDPFLLRTAPTLDRIAALASECGFSEAYREDDPLQPVYHLGLR